jgi:transcriptional regulator with XRE-family HTH domain
MSPPTQVARVTTYRAIVGRLLAARRSGLNLDQRTLATAVGLTQSTWSRIESGTSSLSLDQLKRACDVLRVLPGVMLEQADQVSSGIMRCGVEVLHDRCDEADRSARYLGGDRLTELMLAILSKKKLKTKL